MGVHSSVIAAGLQMDRAVASGATGRRFESCQAYQLTPHRQSSSLLDNQPGSFPRSRMLSESQTSIPLAEPRRSPPGENKYQYFMQLNMLDGRGWVWRRDCP